MKKLFVILLLCLSVQNTAYAINDEKISKFKTVLEGCGAMPRAMIIGFVLLAVIAVITIAELRKGGDSK